MATAAAGVPPPLSLTEGAILHLEERLAPVLEGSSTPLDRTNPIVRLLVIDALRYRVDQHWRQTTKQPEPESPSDADPDVYDLVLTDGTHKAKASLDARHNDVLRRGGLVDYVIELDRSMVEWCYDDSRVPARRLMVIRKFNLCEDMVSVDKSKLAATSELATTLWFQPLAGTRLYYLPMWNDDDPLMDDPQWRANKDALKVPDDLRLPSRLESVSDAIASAANHPKPPPALVGRVMSRHTLSHFGKAMDTKDGFPYRFTFEIGDSDTSVPVVAWNRMASRLFTAVSVNQLVVIENYKLRKQFNSTGGGVEISVNSVKPEGHVRLLKEENMSDVSQWRLRYPERERIYESASTMSLLPDGTIFDLIGRVLLTSRVERERSSKGTFSQYMWLALIDKSAQSPVLVKLYTCSQPWDFFSIRPGSVVRLHNVKLYSMTVDSRTPRQQFCVTTYSTTMNVFNDRKGEFSASIHGQQVAHVPKETELIKSLYVRDVFVGLTPPYTDIDMMRRFVEGQVIAFAVMLEEAKGLQFMERRTFVAQGRIASIALGDAFVGEQARQMPMKETFIENSKEPEAQPATKGIHYDAKLKPSTVNIVDLEGSRAIAAVLPCIFYAEEDPFLTGLRQVFPLCAPAEATPEAFGRSFHQALDAKPDMLMLVDAVRLSPFSVQFVLLKAIPV